MILLVLANTPPTLDITWLYAILPILTPVIIAIVTIAIMSFLSQKKQDIIYVQTAIQVIQKFFGNQWGANADQLFNIWLECIQKVQDGKWTQDEMIAAFFRIIATAKLSMTDQEKDIIVSYTQAYFKMPGIIKNSSIKLNSLKLY